MLSMAVKALKKVGVALAAVVALLLMAQGLSLLLQPKNNQVEFGMIESGANGVMGERENSIDVLFVGDSEVYSAYSPLQMWNEFGFTSYDASTSGQVLPYTNTLLKRAFASQSPRVVVFESNAFFREFSLGDGIFRTVEDMFPVFEYHNRWKSLTLADFTNRPQTTWTDPNKGFKIRAETSETDISNYGNPTNEVFKVPRNNRIWMKAMVSLCMEHGATPVFMSTPTPINWNMAKHNGVQELADELGVEYIDLNLAHDKIGIDWKSDSYDKGDHLNYGGAIKVSRYTGKLLADNFGLADHREDPAYNAWNAAFDRYKNELPSSNA